MSSPYVTDVSFTILHMNFLLSLGSSSIPDRVEISGNLFLKPSGPTRESSEPFASQVVPTQDSHRYDEDRLTCPALLPDNVLQLNCLIAR